MLNNWLFPRQEEMLLIDIDLYHQVWLINIISREKVQKPYGEATRVRGQKNFDLISKKMFK